MIKLKAARVNQDLTLEQASKLLGIHYITLSRWENNKIKVPEIAKMKISDVYKMPIEMIEWGK